MIKEAMPSCFYKRRDGSNGVFASKLLLMFNTSNEPVVKKVILYTKTTMCFVGTSQTKQI